MQMQRFTNATALIVPHLGVTGLMEVPIQTSSTVLVKDAQERCDCLGLFIIVQFFAHCFILLVLNIVLRGCLVYQIHLSPVD